MLKVLVLHHNFPGQFAGVLEMCEEKGHEVTFVCETNYKKVTTNIKVHAIGELQEMANHSAALILKYYVR